MFFWPKMFQKHGLKLVLISATVILLVPFVVLLVMRVHEGQNLDEPFFEPDIDIGSIASAKIERLYQDKAGEIEGYAEELFDLWSYAESVDTGTERDDDGWGTEAPFIIILKDTSSGEYNLFLYGLEVSHQECVWDCPERLKTFFDMLWSEYDVDLVELTSDWFGFEIISDQLRYYPEGSYLYHEIKLDEHWSHFWFEYGI